MKVTPCNHGLDGMVGHSTGPRSPGLHISDIYGDLYKRLQPDRYKGGELDRVRLEAGLSFETMLEEGLKQRLSAFRPGEMASPEGIAMSPDIIIYEAERLRVGEIKLTWMSMRELPTCEAKTLPPKFDKWLCQIKAYCHILETAHARLLGYFVNGDYKPPAPKFLAYDLEFTARELRENWAMLINHARHVMKVL